jgi:hypothetical protein
MSFRLGFVRPLFTPLVLYMYFDGGKCMGPLGVVTTTSVISLTSINVHLDHSVLDGSLNLILG